jgi:hypothetical protein
VSVSEKKLIEGACNRLADASLYTSAAIDLRTDGVGRERTNGSESPDGEGSQGVRARAVIACTRAGRLFADDDGDGRPANGDGRTRTDGDGSRSSALGTDGDRCRSSFAVPMDHGEARHGMLVVCAPIGSAFGDDEAAALTDLADAIGHAIDAKRALITDSLVELDVRIDDADHFITHVSAAANCTVSLDGAVRRNGDTLLYFCTTSGADPEDGLEIARDSAVIERVRLVRTSADERADDRTDDGVESYFEFTYSGPCPVVLLSDHGAEVLELNASDGTTRLRCELSRSADVRRVVESLREEVPGTHLLAKHEGARDRRESNGTSVEHCSTISPIVS